MITAAITSYTMATGTNSSNNIECIYKWIKKYMGCSLMNKKMMIVRRFAAVSEEYFGTCCHNDQFCPRVLKWCPKSKWKNVNKHSGSGRQVWEMLIFGRAWTIIFIISTQLSTLLYQYMHIHYYTSTFTIVSLSRNSFLFLHKAAQCLYMLYIVYICVCVQHF